MTRKLVDDWFGAFADKDLARLERILTETFVHTSPYGAVNGREAYLDLVRQNPVAFFSPKIEILDVIEGKDKVAVRYLVNGNPACDCIYDQDGRISKIFSYYHVGKKLAY